MCFKRLQWYYNRNDLMGFVDVYGMMDDRNVRVYNLMMIMYKKHGKYRDGINVFENIQDKMKNVISYSIGIELYSKLKHIQCCQRLFDVVNERNTNIYNIMMNAYFDNGMYNRSIELFLSDDMTRYRDNVSGNIAVKAYLKMNDVANAEKVFHSVGVKDNFTLNSMMKGYNDNEMYRKTIALFLLDEVRNCRNNISGNIVMEAYSKLSDIGSCENVFNAIKNKSQDSYVAMMEAYNENKMYNKTIELYGNDAEKLQDYRCCNIAIQAYSKLNNMDMCRKVFDGIKEKKVISVNFMMQSYNENKMHHQTIELFNKMQQLKDNISCNIAIQAYSKLNDISNCQKVFNSTENKDKAVYGAMLQAYNDNKMYDKTIELFSSNQMEKFKDNINCNIAIIAYSKLNDIQSCERIFSDIKDKNIDVYNTMMQVYNEHKNYAETIEIFESNDVQKIKDNISCNIAIQAYSKLNNIIRCETIFESISHKDIVSLNSMMQAYHDNKMYDQGIKLFTSYGMKNSKNNISSSIAIETYSMLNDIKSCKEIFESIENKDSVLFNCMMQAYKDNKMYDETIQLYLSNEMESLKDNISDNIAIQAYSKMNDIENCEFVFNRIEHKQEINYMTIMHAYNDNKLYDKTVELFSDNIREWTNNNVYHIAMEAYSKLDNIEQTEMILEGIENKTLVSYTVIMTAYRMKGYWEKLLKLFDELCRQKVRLSVPIFCNALYCCGDMNSLEKGQWVLYKLNSKYNRHLVCDGHILAAIVSLFGRCNQYMNEARAMYDIIIRNDNIKNDINRIHVAILDCYTKYGDIDEVLHLYNTLVNNNVIISDEIYSIVLNCCSHVGDMEQCINIFNQYLIMNDNIIKNSYILTTLIDCFGRNNWMDYAEHYYNTYKHSIKDNKAKSVILLSMLSSCRIHHDIQRAQEILQLLQHTQHNTHM